MRYLAALITALIAMPACGPSQADGDRACRSSEACEQHGACWYNPSLVSADLGIAGSPIGSTGVTTEQCEARSDGDCRASQMCRLIGACYRNEGTGGPLSCISR